MKCSRKWTKPTAWNKRGPKVWAWQQEGTRKPGEDLTKHTHIVWAKHQRSILWKFSSLFWTLTFDFTIIVLAAKFLQSCTYFKALIFCCLPKCSYIQALKYWLRCPWTAFNWYLPWPRISVDSGSRITRTVNSIIRDHPSCMTQSWSLLSTKSAQTKRFNWVFIDSIMILAYPRYRTL